MIIAYYIDWKLALLSTIMIGVYVWLSSESHKHLGWKRNSKGKYA